MGLPIPQPCASTGYRSCPNPQFVPPHVIGLPTHPHPGMCPPAPCRAAPRWGPTGVWEAGAGPSREAVPSRGCCSQRGEETPLWPLAGCLRPPSSPPQQPRCREASRESLAGGRGVGSSMLEPGRLPPPGRELLAPNGSPELWGQPGSLSWPVLSLLQWGWPQGGRAFPSPAPPKKQQKKALPKSTAGLCAVPSSSQAALCWALRVWESCGECFCYLRAPNPPPPTC